MEKLIRELIDKYDLLIRGNKKCGNKKSIGIIDLVDQHYRDSFEKNLIEIEKLKTEIIILKSISFIYSEKEMYNLLRKFFNDHVNTQTANIQEWLDENDPKRIF